MQNKIIASCCLAVIAVGSIVLKGTFDKEKNAKAYADYLQQITDAPFCSQVAKFEDSRILLPPGFCRWDLELDNALQRNFVGAGADKTTIIFDRRLF